MPRFLTLLLLSLFTISFRHLAIIFRHAAAIIYAAFAIIDYFSLLMLIRHGHYDAAMLFFFSPLFDYATLLPFFFAYAIDAPLRECMTLSYEATPASLFEHTDVKNTLTLSLSPHHSHHMPYAIHADSYCRRRFHAYAIMPLRAWLLYTRHAATRHGGDDTPCCAMLFA